MAVTVVVGGQFGSEGKGKVAQYLAAERGASAVVRVGGSNSGHTGFGSDGALCVLRHLPTAALLSDVVCVLGAGSYIDPAVLLAEIELTGLAKDRLVIDRRAMIITEADRQTEADLGLTERIGSTGSGTGGAVMRRIARQGGVSVRDVPELRRYLGDATAVLRELLASDERVIIEGTQGFGLSLLHSDNYPNVTSRDTSAAGMLAEAGLSPLDVDEVVLVLRAYPIRVGGNSGPLPREMDWATVTAGSGSGLPIAEFTSVTGRLRRVGEFDPDVVRSAIAANNPSLIVMNHVDHVDVRCGEIDNLTPAALAFLDNASSAIGAPIGLAGIGPSAMVTLGASVRARLAS